MSIRLVSIRLLVATAVFAAGGAAPVVAEDHAYVFDCEDPIAWSDTAVIWGMGGVFDWTCAGGGKPGKALRITTAENRQVIAKETRCLQFNHEPGTPARIQFDVKFVAFPDGARMRVRYYDGYVTAEAFEYIGDDEFQAFPDSIWDSAKQPAKDWHHADVTTAALKNPVLTMAFMVEDPKHNAKKDPNAVEYPDILLDNLRVDTAASLKILDPGFEWDGKGGGKMLEWRSSTKGAFVPWCDLMQEEDVPTPAGVIHFTMTTFRDTTSRRGGHMKHDFLHNVQDVFVGGASVIGLSSIHGDAAAAEWGIRQTFAYSALDLKPGEAAKISIKVKDTVHDPKKEHVAKLQIGCDPRGQILPARATWTPETTPNWDEGAWQTHALEIERPADATAMTVFWRMRDGAPAKMKGPDGKEVDDPDSRATNPGCKGFADWVLIKVEK